ncbi:hypothetical protein VR46_31310 [Streptomyces sp. NRRL S-444]|nr:hypothetical protein VR46_31310 [Streptomyces sp. NRRL S-444]
MDGDLLTYVEAAATECLQQSASAVNQPLPLSEIGTLLQSVDDCTWIPEPDHTRLRVSCRLLIADQFPGLALEAVASAAGMESHARQHGSNTWKALTGWIILEQPSSTDLLTATSETVRSTQPVADPRLLHAISGRLAALPLPEQTDFWQRLIGAPRKRVPQQSLIDAGWPQLPDTHAAAILLQRYVESSNNSDRQDILDLWKSASITSDTALRKLIESVIIPMLEVNQTGAEMALGHLPRLIEAVPKGTRTVEGRGEQRQDVAKPRK